MKHQISFSCLLLSSIIFLSSSAQDIVTPNEPLQSPGLFAPGKENKSDYYLIANKEVTTKVLRAFDSYFKNCNDIRWYRYHENYMAQFEEGTMNSKALFTKNGCMLYSLSVGKEEDLPQNMRRLVRSNYIDFAIGRCMKVLSDHQTAWIINLQDAERFVIIKANDYTFEEIESHSIAHK